LSDTDADALAEAEALSLADADSDADAEADADALAEAESLAEAELLALSEAETESGTCRPVTAAVAEPGSRSDAASSAAPAAATRPAATASPVLRSPLGWVTLSDRATACPLSRNCQDYSGHWTTSQKATDRAIGVSIG
jgi:hypothetical protein